MAKLVFNDVGERLFETGVKNGVLYVMNEDGTYGNGVVWNGLTAVTESPSGAETTPLYADDIKYVVLYAAEVTLLHIYLYINNMRTRARVSIL